jgi:DnaD/phage-associated family protein
MAPFTGFPEGKVRLVPVPGPLFTELLPEIDHLGELKVVLYAIWRLDQMEGAFRYLRRDDFAGDERFMQGLGADLDAAGAALDEALALAVERGGLLMANLPASGNGEDTLYFLNTPKGRSAVDAIRQGRWRPSPTPQMPIELALEHPNIFRLYEENIGPLTPLIADALREAEQAYPASWVADAFRIAVENNKRSWRYIEAILVRWKEKGRDERKDKRDTEKDRQRYADWEQD